MKKHHIDKGIIKGKIIVKLKYKDYPTEYINVISGKIFDNKLHIIQRYSNKEITCIDLDDISYWKYEKCILNN